MPARVFISCGQQPGVERQAAERIKRWFESRGFIAYVATNIQTLTELNQNIVEALKSSDYYLFINFKRERLTTTGKRFRGSVYTQQELAIAYALGFQDMLLLNQKGTLTEGIHHFIVSNSGEFISSKDLLKCVRTAVRRHSWNKNHSRHLRVTQVGLSQTAVRYSDHVGLRNAWIVTASIQNARPDICARTCSARCVRVSPGGSAANRGHLKVNGHIGYQQLIWPGDTGGFDLLNILTSHESVPHQPPYPSAIVPSDLDLSPTPVLFHQGGVYSVTYEVYAENFPPLIFTITVDVTRPTPTVRLSE